ncbi:MAG: Fe-S cluster assembly protein SufD [Muribaculaceae bacterium]
MSSIKQYIDFFTSQRVVIEAKSSTQLNSLRDKALSMLAETHLQKKGEENYEITDLNEMFAPDYGININRIEMQVNPADAFRCDVPNMTTWLYFMFNDLFHNGRASGISLPDGVVVTSLNEAALKYPALVSKYYGKIASLDNAQTALNTLLVQDGLFIYIPDGVVLERPLQLVNILNSTIPVMANRRILIILGRDAQAKLLVCDHTQNKEMKYLNSQVIELFAGENSVFDLYDIEESSADTHRVSSLYASQEKGSNLLINGITLVNGFTRNNYYISVDGEYSETHLLGMAISNDTQHIDNYTYIAHNVPNCKSNELFKYVLDDNARGAFTGKILVAEGAQKTEAYQSNKNICASKTAKMHTKPQLEIYTDDVKCSHGATIGQLDQNALFYMRTRGISQSEAKTLLMQAFMSDVIDGVRMEALKDRLRHLVEKRFYGNKMLCNECSASCHDKQIN